MPATPEEVMPNAGWYPDPARSSLLRYWDGQSWTDRLEYANAVTGPRYDYADDGSIFQLHEYA